MSGALIRYGMIAERAAPSDEALEHIASQLFVPLVRHHASLCPMRIDRCVRPVRSTGAFDRCVRPVRSTGAFDRCA